MTISTQTDQQERATGACFVTTRWSVVLSARNQTVPVTDGAQALETLCRNYWPPIYSFARRQGYAPCDAQDLTQAFFAHLLKSDFLSGVDQAKGRFRSFLLASIKNFLANEWDKAKAIKRGAGEIPVSIDAQVAETTCFIGLADTQSADKIYDRRWAITLLDRTMGRLKEQYASDGKLALFEALKETLTGERGGIPYAQIATGLKTSEGAIKVAVHRLRQHYRELLRAEIAETVASKEDVEEELKELFAALM